MYIEKINGPEDVKKLSLRELPELASEMRKALIQRASIHMGHVGPDLGFIEATVALHYVFSSPKDKIVFDVSHQTYPHKMLTGRKDAYLYEEHYDDVSPYSSPAESPHDFFEIGHTSTSIDLALGLAKARDLKGERENIIAVIGDGSLSGGEALEGLNIAGELSTNFIILVNDNQMSIAENHGGLYRNLEELRDTEGRAENNLFRAMGLDYLYLPNGNDIASLAAAFEKVKDIGHPIVVHINTEKGKGYPPAERDKEKWHWHLPFYIETGETKEEYRDEGEDYESETAKFLLEKMEKDPSVIAVSSAVPGVLGFTKELRERAGRQYMDVGIAEQSGVAVASGIAKNGGKPIYFTSATFLQRAYDQLSQDVAINHTPVTILAGSASIYGMRDKTHLGLYALPMLSNIPELAVLAPEGKEEYFSMLEWSIEQRERPVVILIPADDLHPTNHPVRKDYGRLGEFCMARSGREAALLAYGALYQTAEKAADILREKLHHEVTLIDPCYVSHIDRAMLEGLKKEHRITAVLEDGILEGGFAPKISSFYADSDMRVLEFGLEKKFYDRYDIEALLRERQLTSEQIAERILRELSDRSPL